MSLAGTKLQNVRVNSPLFDKNEHRLSEYGAFNFFVQQSRTSPLLTEEMREKAKASMGKTLQMPVINYDGGISISSVRNCTIADAENTSQFVGVTFATYAVGFTMVRSMYGNNEVDYMRDLEKKYLKCARVLGAALDSAALAALGANKSKVFADTLIYKEDADTIVVPFTSREDILSDIEPMMNANDFYGSVHIIGNAGVRSLLNKLAEKGANNIVDKSMEWAGKYFHFTNRLANDSGAYATFYAVEDGNVDILFRYDRESVLGTTTKVGHEWDVVTMPYLDIPVGLHYYESVGDQSAIGGDSTTDLTCAAKEHYGFSVDVAFVVAYNSAPETRANPIILAEIAGGDTYAAPVQVVNSETNPIPTKAVGA